MRSGSPAGPPTRFPGTGTCEKSARGDSRADPAGARAAPVLVAGEGMSKVLRGLGVSIAVAVGGLGILLVPQALPFVIWAGATAAVIGYHSPRAIPVRVLRLRGGGRGARAAEAAGAVVGGGAVLVGLAALVGAVGTLLAGGVGAVLLWRELRGRQQPRDTREPVPQPGPVAAAPAMPSAIARMPTAQLCWAWRTSYLALQTTTDARSLDRLAAMRRCYLDELEHRDPVGFRRWLDSGARAPSDPLRYIRTDAEPGTRDAGATG